MNQPKRPLDARIILAILLLGSVFLVLFSGMNRGDVRNFELALIVVTLIVLETSKEWR